MRKASFLQKIDYLVIFAMFILIATSIFVLNSISPEIFPQYYIFIALGSILFLVIYNIDFDFFETFSLHFYILSVVLLIVTIAIGQVTRGAVRWIPIGSLTLQPSEIARPFVILFLAKYLSSSEITISQAIKVIVLFVLPFFLILIQPSLGVSLLLLVGFIGVLIASTVSKKNLFMAGLISILLIPLLWLILAPYQKQRIQGFVDPSSDPLGAGYNSIQAMISVGSGKFLGRGLGKGVQTQLAFLPEKHTDFVFAAISEELGFLGSSLIVIAIFIVLWRMIGIISDSKSLTRRSFVTGMLLSLLIQTIIHIGMNMGMLPITGLPLPLVSAGGSAFLATMIALGLTFGSIRKSL